ncbi:MAG: AAA family ATPase, partial [Bacteroidota bacterium]
SECTEEELAAIELRSPNYSDQFNIIRLANPKKGLKEIVLNRANDLSRTKKVRLSEEAIQEVIRLNLRYTPYSGLPGKPIRFIENLLLETKQNKSLVRSDIIEHFCEETGMPTFMVDPSIPMDVEAVEQRFNKNVFGQVEAVRKVVSILASVKAALTRKEKPIASFLFVGPTGVGKTELAKVLAEFMFNDRERMLRFDMSEYSNPVSLSRLIGSSFGSDGTLTAAVRRTPFSVLLFDEIEKADYKFYDLLLQILSEGRLTDNQGKLVNFCSTIIIMTSNIGASRPAPIALGNSEAAESVAQHYLSAVQKHFRPELFGRIDEVIPFLPLSQAVVREVVKREIELFRKREGIHFRPIQLDIAAPVLDHLASVGYDSKYGARHLQRSLRDELILPLSKQLNFESGDDHLQIEVRLDEQQKITITVTADPMGFDRYMEQWDKQVNADHASELRRKMETLQDGLRYIELKDELMRMERIKLRRKEEFWQNKYYAKRYPSYLTCQQNIQALAQKVEQLETNLSLSYLDLGPYQTAPEEQLSAWEKSFSGIKKELYRTLQPESDFCHLAVYGTHLQSIVHFYSELFRLKAFEYELE